MIPVRTTLLLRLLAPTILIIATVLLYLATRHWSYLGFTVSASLFFAREVVTHRMLRHSEPDKYAEGWAMVYGVRFSAILWLIATVSAIGLMVHGFSLQR